MLTILAITLFSVVINAKLDIPEGYTLTPHGLRPSKCVISIKSNSHELIETTDGLIVKYFDNNEDEFHPKDLECVENAAHLGLQHSKKRLNRLQKRLNNKNNNNNNNNSVGILEGGGWELYGGYYTTSIMGYFGSTYTYPQSKPQTENGQVLFYFIGAQDNSDNNLTIIQPVATYAPNGNGNAAPPGFSGTPWNCCPSGLSNYGKPIAASEGSVFDTYVQSDDSTGKVTVSMVLQSTGEKSQLVLQSDYRQYNWIDVTGEFYWDVGTCGELIDTPFGFTDFQITAMNGDNQSPNWDVSESTNIRSCNPQQSYSASQASITGTASS